MLDQKQQWEDKGGNGNTDSRDKQYTWWCHINIGCSPSKHNKTNVPKGRSFTKSKENFQKPEHHRNKCRASIKQKKVKVHTLAVQGIQKKHPGTIKPISTLAFNRPSRLGWHNLAILIKIFCPTWHVTPQKHLEFMMPWYFFVSFPELDQSKKVNVITFFQRVTFFNDVLKNSTVVSRDSSFEEISFYSKLSGRNFIMNYDYYWKPRLVCCTFYKLGLLEIELGVKQ